MLLQRIRRRLRDDAGTSTAEYAVLIMVAVAFAGVMMKVLTSSTVYSELSNLVTSALNV